ncbi:hypothetical protein pb186bvf_006953 [Paramecium bursaria]
MNGSKFNIKPYEQKNQKYKNSLSRYLPIKLILYNYNKFHHPKFQSL